MPQGSAEAQEGVREGGIHWQIAPFSSIWALLLSVCLLCISAWICCDSASILCVSELDSGAERAHHIQQIVATLPRTVVIVMRYLFAFLNQ